jgi:hypothetical protein
VRPEEFRRKYRRRRFVFRPLRLSVAALLALGVFGGSWVLVASLMRDARPDGDRAFAMRDPAPALDAAPAAVEAASGSDNLDDAPPVTGVVHHARPPAGSDSVAPEHASHNESNAGSADAPPIIVAEFAVVLHAEPDAQVEDSMSNVAAAVGVQAALVRNFSYPDAQRLAEEYRLAHDPERRGGENPVVAQAPGVGEARETAITRAELQELAQHVREQLRLRDARGDSPALAAADGTTIAAAATLAPTLEQQLDFSSRGASYTLAVHASALPGVIERLALDQPLGTTLCMLPPASIGAKPAASVSHVSPMLVWLTEGPLVRQAIARLSQAKGEALILVPVITR